MAAENGGCHGKCLTLNGPAISSTPARRSPARPTSLKRNRFATARPTRRQIDDMAKISPFKFLQEVRVEAQKVTWPTRRETAVTTAMVFVMVAIAAVFFLLADQVMRMFVTLILGIGG